MKPSMRTTAIAIVLVVASVLPVGDAVRAGAAPEGGLPPQLALEPVVTLSDPIAMASRAGTDDLFVAQRAGQVLVLHMTGGNVTGAPAPLVDVSAFTDPGPGERGLLGLTFNPSGTKLYLHYTNLDGNTRVVEYAMSAGGTGDNVVLASRRVVLKVHQPFANHNGGELTFGPDHRLYLALGDGGDAGDPFNNGQNLRVLLGKVLRINPAAASGGRNFTPPASNPFFTQPPRRKAIWLYGVRNPWRISFDRDTGDLYVADVGQGQTEEVDVLPADGNGLNAGRGVNLGWRRMEGNHPFNGATEPANHTPPVFTYEHGGGPCAVVGGYVYRGNAIPTLDGTYLFGDFCTGVIEAIVVANGTTLTNHFPNVGLDVANNTLQSFGQGPDGELYVLQSSGAVSRIVAGP
jgi:glucose/arabinose dehydrogenase